MEKELYKEMYLHLFRQVTEAVECLQTEGNVIKVGEILVNAQRACEEMFISAE